MPAERTDEIEALLVEAEAAHGTYEADELGGVYDRDWASWYAAYAVEHGIGERLGHDVAVDRLSALLADSFPAYKASGREGTESWAAYTAGRIVADL